MATDPRGVRAFDPPGFEIVRGERRYKVSPARLHARVQARMVVALAAWAQTRGEATVEWDIDVTLPGEEPTYFRPDIAFVSSRRLAECATLEQTLPHIAPELIIEVLSPNDREREVVEKIDIYLQAGTDVVLIADPAKRIVRVYDRSGERVMTQRDVFEHAALPGLRIDLAEVFPPPEP